MSKCLGIHLLWLSTSSHWLFSHFSDPTVSHLQVAPPTPHPQCPPLSMFPVHILNFAQCDSFSEKLLLRMITPFRPVSSLQGKRLGLIDRNSHRSIKEIESCHFLPDPCSLQGFPRSSPNKGFSLST